MKLKLTRLIPSTALVCLLFASCKKEDAVSKPSSVTTQNAQVVSMIGAMQNESNVDAADALAAQDFTAADVEACPNRTITPAAPTFPRTVVLDYGSGCTDANGRTISGQKIINLQADYRTAPAGTVISVVTFSNYYVNGVSVAGNIVNKVTAPVNPGPFVLRSIFHKTVSDGAGNTSTYIGVLDRTLIGGSATGPKVDRVYQIRENSFGVELSPDAPPAIWSLHTDGSTPPIKSGDCLFTGQGKVHITLLDINGTTNETLDYGDGTCDNTATLRVDNGAPQSITLPFIFFTQHL